MTAKYMCGWRQLIERKITRINLNGFRPIGRGAGHWEWRANTEEVREAVRRAWERCYPDRVAPPEPEEAEAQSNCGVGSFLNIILIRHSATKFHGL